MISTHLISVIMSTSLVGIKVLKGEEEFKTCEALESVRMLSLLDDHDQEAYQLLKRNKLVQQPIIEQYNGELISYKNHSITAKFSTALDAVLCADAILRIIDTEPDINLRIGIHLGEFKFIDNVVSGDGLAVVAALESVAPVGCIIVSEAIHTNVINRQGVISSQIEFNPPSNITDEFRAFQIAVIGNIPKQKTGLIRRSLGKIRDAADPKLFATIIFLFLGISFYLIYSNNSQDSIVTTRSETSIVVLPFVNMSQNPQQGYFSDGITEEIINHLINIDEIKVISRVTAMTYKNSNMPIVKIAEELDVASVLQGSVRISGDQLRISIQLIDGVTEDHLWAETYDHKLEGIFDIQTEVARNIANFLTQKFNLK